MLACDCAVATPPSVRAGGTVGSARCVRICSTRARSVTKAISRTSPSQLLHTNGNNDARHPEDTVPRRPRGEHREPVIPFSLSPRVLDDVSELSRIRGFRNTHLRTAAKYEAHLERHLRFVAQLARDFRVHDADHGRQHFQIPSLDDGLDLPEHDMAVLDPRRDDEEEVGAAHEC